MKKNYTHQEGNSKCFAKYSIVKLRFMFFILCFPFSINAQDLKDIKTETLYKILADLPENPKKNQSVFFPIPANSVSEAEAMAIQQNVFNSFCGNKVLLKIFECKDLGIGFAAIQREQIISQKALPLSILNSLKANKRIDIIVTVIVSQLDSNEPLLNATMVDLKTGNLRGSISMSARKKFILQKNADTTLGEKFIRQLISEKSLVGEFPILAELESVLNAILGLMAVQSKLASIQPKLDSFQSTFR